VEGMVKEGMAATSCMATSCMARQGMAKEGAHLAVDVVELDEAGPLEALACRGDNQVTRGVPRSGN
jgi:hypothetical protein